MEGSRSSRVWTPLPRQLLRSIPAPPRQWATEFDDNGLLPHSFCWRGRRWGPVQCVGRRRRRRKAVAMRWDSWRWQRAAHGVRAVHALSSDDGGALCSPAGVTDKNVSLALSSTSPPLGHCNTNTNNTTTAATPSSSRPRRRSSAARPPGSTTARPHRGSPRARR